MGSCWLILSSFDWRQLDLRTSLFFDGEDCNCCGGPTVMERVPHYRIDPLVSLFASRDCLDGLDEFFSRINEATGNEWDKETSFANGYVPAGPSCDRPSLAEFGGELKADCFLAIR
jgi:hypothetical protein